MTAQRIYDTVADDFSRVNDLIVKRLEEYERRTAPVLDYYKKVDKSMTINAKGSREEVFERLSGSVENAFKNIR